MESLESGPLAGGRSALHHSEEGRRGAEMLPSVTSEGENTQITPALCLQMDNIYNPTQLLLSSQQIPLHHIPGLKTDGQFRVESRDLKIWVEALGSIIYLGLQMLTSLPTKADIPAITFIKRALSAPQQNLLSALIIIFSISPAPLLVTVTEPVYSHPPPGIAKCPLHDLDMTEWRD